MRGISHAFRLLTGSALLVLTAACSGDDGEDLVPCPEAKVMGEPSELTRFADGPGRDPTDILFEASFRRVVGDCNYDSDGGPIAVELTVRFDVLRGQANRKGEASFRYFVAVAERGEDTGPQPLIHGREAFSITESFAPTQKGIGYTDVLEITIPRPDARDVRRYVLYLGFELTPEELKYNQRKHGF